jgi:hypothetical protein
MLWITVSHRFHSWVELLIEMDLEVWNTFIQKIITIQECRCIMRDMNMFRYGDMIFRNVVDYDKSLFPLVSHSFHWEV